MYVGGGGGEFCGCDVSPEGHVEEIDNLLKRNSNADLKI